MPSALDLHNNWRNSLGDQQGCQGQLWLSNPPTIPILLAPICSIASSQTLGKSEPVSFSGQQGSNCLKLSKTQPKAQDPRPRLPFPLVHPTHGTSRYRYRYRFRSLLTPSLFRPCLRSDHHRVSDPPASYFSLKQIILACLSRPFIFSKVAGRCSRFSQHLISKITLRSFFIFSKVSGSVSSFSQHLISKEAAWLADDSIVRSSFRRLVILSRVELIFPAVFSSRNKPCRVWSWLGATSSVETKMTKTDQAPNTTWDGCDLCMLDVQCFKVE
ncbi:hypothetical protein OSB04_018126 [Centaurea solstitialis]|uniref:Uncharacterized protein n=1 Tax=Centaurea solstitialis TaxID=347529 RepID=A0AA38TF48_9ASTR|nr:hypothetical protein OSB04_018126 [Centaurea solstitialis]